MDLAAIVQLAIQYAPIVKGLIDAATSNTDLVSKLEAEAKPVAGLITQLGGMLFPGAPSTLHAVAGAVAAFDPNTTKWLQGALNAVMTPSPNLTVDGLYGPKTAAAVKAFQTAHGLAVDGIAGLVTQAALTAVLTKLPKLA